jgi:aminopeptidase N
MNLDKFYQSQLIWDETMAENIDAYIKKNPNTTVVVLVGSGHIEKHHGIPSRVFRRNGLEYQVIINNPHKAISGDIVVLNRTKTSVPKEKKIGVALNNNKDLTVLKVVKDSFGEKIKIKKGDRIIKLNGKDVSTIADIKRVLYLNDLKDIKVTIRRDKELIELKKDKK